VGWPPFRWLETEKDNTGIEVRGWKSKAPDRDTQRSIAGVVKARTKLQNQWKKKNEQNDDTHKQIFPYIQMECTDLNLM
jgi:hypothetical protein